MPYVECFSARLGQVVSCIISLRGMLLCQAKLGSLMYYILTWNASLPGQVRQSHVLYPYVECFSARLQSRCGRSCSQSRMLSWRRPRHLRPVLLLPGQLTPEVFCPTVDTAVRRTNSLQPGQQRILFYFDPLGKIIYSNFIFSTMIIISMIIYEFRDHLMLLRDNLFNMLNNIIKHY